MSNPRPKSTIVAKMKRIIIEHEWSRLILPVIVGALLSAIPVLASLHIQLKSQREDARQGRRLDAIAAYLRACNQIVDDGYRINEIAERNFSRLDRGRYLEEHEMEAIDDEIQAFRRDSDTHWLDYRVQVDIINLIFGQNIDRMNAPEIAEIDLASADEEARKKLFADRKVKLDFAAKHCRSSTERLLASANP